MRLQLTGPRATAAAAALLAATLAHADAVLSAPPQLQLPALQPAPAVGELAACIAPLKGAADRPEFPDSVPGEIQHARVVVDLTFTDAARAPGVHVIERPSDGAFVRAVKRHASQLRASCLRPGEQVTRRVEFVFNKNDDERVVTAPRGFGERARRDWETRDADCASSRGCGWVCTTNNFEIAAPTYPTNALRAGTQGRVHAVLALPSPDQPPTVETFVGAPSADVLARAIARWASELRARCVPTGITQAQAASWPSDPVRMSFDFLFSFEGGQSFGLHDLSLPQLLGMTNPQTVSGMVLDTRKMACPFSLQLTYLQPRLPNRVSQMDDYHPSRELLLEWLRRTELELKPIGRASAFGSTARVDVPCMAIDLSQ